MKNQENNMNEFAVRTTSVCKGFGEGEARLGELLMLVGPSGCGKTTLLSVIAGTLGVDRSPLISSIPCGYAEARNMVFPGFAEVWHRRGMIKIRKANERGH